MTPHSWVSFSVCSLMVAITAITPNSSSYNNSKQAAFAATGNIKHATFCAIVFSGKDLQDNEWDRECQSSFELSQLYTLARASRNNKINDTFDSVNDCS